MRREFGVGPVARVAKGVSLDSLLALLEAASASPTACHRLASLALIFDSAMNRTRTGSNQATPDLLPKLVKAAHRENRKIRRLEDFIPHDARLEVEVRWDGDMYRLLPGSLDQPVGMVECLRMLADVIDPVLVEHVEFGLSDVVELVLRRIDHVASALAPAWSTRQEAIGTPPHISDRELAAAETLLGISNQVASCRNPDRAQLALEILSVSPQRLVFNSSGGVPPFGAVIGVRKNSGKIVPLPAGILVDCLSEVGGRLAEIACGFDPTVEKRWKRKMEGGVAYLLAGSGHPIVGPLKTPDGKALHSAIRYSDRQVVVLDVEAGIQQSAMSERLAESTENLNQAARGTELTADGETIPMSPDAQVVTLQILAHPDRNPPPSGDHASVHLRGFMWLVRTTARNPEDLWYFLRDLNDFKRTTKVFSVDLLDGWEMWQSGGKSFPLGGIPFRGMFITPFWGGEVEWVAASESAVVEKALLALGLPQLSVWPILDNTDDRVYLGNAITSMFCQVLPGRVPVVISMTDFHDRSTDRRILWAFAEGIVWKLRHMKESFQAAADLSGLEALHIGFLRNTSTAREPLHVAERVGSMVTLGWSSDLPHALHEDSLAIEALTGRLLSEVFDSPAARQAFVSGWDKAPPGVRRDSMLSPASAQQLPQPERSHSSQIAALNRSLGKHLLSKSVKPGTFEGDQAEKIVNEIVYPWAQKELHRIIRPYNTEALLRLAFEELERANCERLLHVQQLALMTGFPVHADIEAGGVDRRSEMAQLGKAISLILEETLARPPTGNATPDRSVWSQVLPVAQLAYASRYRSETLRLRLTRAEIIVTDRYEVHFREYDEPTDVDMTAHDEQRAKATLPGPIPISVQKGETPIRDTKPWGQEYPELAELDLALKQEMEFGLDALIGVLYVSMTGGGTAEDPFATTTPSDFADAATNQILDVTRGECREAIRWLTLTQESLRAEEREYWESDRRAARVDTRPFVEYNSSLYVSPWTAMATLTILFNYLEDGRLPWPRKVLPTGVNKALARYRQGKNKDLERDCSAIVADTELHVLQNVEAGTAKRCYGFDSLYGEIDLLCVDAERSRIWVVEAKDPIIPFSARQTRYSIGRFHKPDGYVGKLLRKVEDVKRNALAFADALDIENPERKWDIRGLMVTRRVNPAAFVVDSLVPFCTIEDFKEVILEC